jgi:hypothetical protein
MQYLIKDIAPIVEPVTTDTAKDHLYLGDDVDTDLLGLYIAMARKYVEKFCGLSIIPQEVIVTYEAPERKIYLPRYTGNAINVAVTEDDLNTMDYIDESEYVINRYATPPYIIHKTGWPKGSHVLVTYTSCVDADAQYLKPMILLIVGHLYENRQIVDTKMANIHYLLGPFRRWYHS